MAFCSFEMASNCLSLRPNTSLELLQLTFTGISATKSDRESTWVYDQDGGKQIEREREQLRLRDIEDMR